MSLTAETMKRGGRYNWKNQQDRLIYIRKFDGWHQFKKIGDPRDVWCEVRDEDLAMLEETPVEKSQDKEQEWKEAFLVRAGFIHGWYNLESWARTMVHQAYVERNNLTDIVK